MNGKCLCGGVAFGIAGALPNLYQCHCSQCRRQGGSVSNTATIVPRDRFCWQAGDTLISRYRHDSGFKSHFCSVCGSPVPNPLGDDWVWVPAGLLEDAGTLAIVAHLFVGSKAHWDVIADAAEQFEQMPELATLVTRLGASPG